MARGKKREGKKQAQAPLPQRSTPYIGDNDCGKRMIGRETMSRKSRQDDLPSPCSSDSQKLQANLPSLAE